LVEFYNTMESNPKAHEESKQIISQQ